MICPTVQKKFQVFILAELNYKHDSLEEQQIGPNRSQTTLPPCIHCIIDCNHISYHSLCWMDFAL